MIEYVELRLYTDAAATTYVLLPNFNTVTFDVKYNDSGAINFSYPLIEATALGLADQSILGVVLGFSNGTSREIERYVVDSTTSDKVVDGVRMKTVNATATLKMLDDAVVYPSNWIRTAVTFWNRTTGVVELTIGAHSYGIGSKVFVTGISDATVNGEWTLSAVTGTTIKFVNAGTNVGSTATSDTWVTQSAPSGHSFSDASIGTIIRTLTDRAQARGALVNVIDTGFSGTNDSLGALWSQKHTQNYSTGTGYYAVLTDFMDRGLLDGWMTGWTLNLANGGSRGNHIAIGTVEIRPAKNVTEMSTSTQSAESASTVLIEGDVGTALERHNSSVQTLLGRRRERFVSQGGIKDAGVLTLLADAELVVHGRIPTEETIGVSPGSLTPFLDFDIADWVWVRYDTDQAPVERRVRQLGVSVDQNRNITLGLTLNTILYEADVALQRRVDAYTGNGGTYGSVPNSIPDTTTPKAPTGLGISSGVYIDGSGQYRAAIIANWTAPTLNVDGSPVTDLDHYVFQYRYNTGTDTEWKSLLPTAGTETTLGYSPVQPGRSIETRVRAVDSDNHFSEWSALITHTVAADVTAPNQPSPPVATDKIGGVSIYWNGLDSGSNPMPADFDRMEIWQSISTPSFTPGVGDAELVGSMPGKGALVVKGGVPLIDTYFKLVAVDKAGNSSVASVSDTGQVLRTVVETPGAAPSGAPAVSVIGGVGTLNVKWELLDPGLTYEVHVSTTSGFTPDLTTLAAETEATVANIRFLRKNLLVNGSFEDAVVPFTPSVGTLARYNADPTQDPPPAINDPVSGIYIGEWNPGTTGAQYVEYNANIPAAVGDKVRIGARMKTPSNAKNFTASIRWFDAGNSLLATSTSTVTASPTTGWGGVSETMQAPASTSYGKYRCNIAAASIGENVYLDLLEVVSDELTEGLVYDTTYYVKVRAKVNGLVGPSSAEVSDDLYKVGNTEISADYGYFGSVNANQITTGDLVATIGITTGKIQVGSLVLDPSGLNIPLTNGGQIALPSSGANAKFLGVEIDATAITIQDKLQILGSDNKIAGKLLMQSSVEAPNVKATINAGYYSIPPDSDIVAMDNSGWAGVADATGIWPDGANYIVCVNTAVYQYVKATGVRTTIQSDFSAVITAYTGGLYSYNATYGGGRAVKIGSDWFYAVTLQHTPTLRAEVAIFKTNATFTTISAAWYSTGTQGLTALYAAQRRCGLYTDGTSLFVAMPVDRDKIRFFSLTAAFGSYTVLWTKTTTTDQNQIFSIMRTAADFGTTRWTLVSGSSGSSVFVKVYDNTGSPAEVTGESWNSQWSMAAMCYDSAIGKIVSLGYSIIGDPNPFLVRWPNVPVDKTIAATFTWWDPDGTQHETTPTSAGVATAAQARRSYFTISTPSPPGDGSVDAADAVRIYARSDGSTTYRLQSPAWIAGQTSQIYTSIDNVSGATPPVSNGFIGVSNPGSFESQGLDGFGDPFIFLKGNGNIKLGNLLFDPNTSDDMEITAGPSGIGTFYVENLDVYGDASFVDLNSQNIVATNSILASSTTDATTSAGNVPALRVGDIAGEHLRIDGNEILAMDTDTVSGLLSLNPGSVVSLGVNNKTIIGFNWGVTTITVLAGTASDGNTITHGLGGAAGAILCVPVATGGWVAFSNASTATTFGINVATKSGANIGANTNVVVYWFAVR